MKSITASTAILQETDSRKAGFETAKMVQEEIGSPKVVLAYLTVNHDAPAFLAAAAEALGTDVPIIGCSTQGIMGRGFFAEDGYIAGVMGISGDGVEAAAAHVEDIPHETREKGHRLGKTLREQMSDDPTLVVVHYDPLCRADIDQLLAGLHAELPCTIVGGAASHPWGPLTTTYQYAAGRVFSEGAVAVAITGDFTVETAISAGCSPVGIEMEVTAAEGNMIRELDGQPAAEVWKSVAGSATQTGGDQTAALSVGVPVDGNGGSPGYLVRAAFGFTDDGAAILQAPVPEGTDVMLHHRTIEDALEGSEAMARDLAGRLEGKTITAVLGFECGGRTKPFLGIDTCRRENDSLQKILGDDGVWLGLLPWGEIHPIGDTPRFNNYTYPMLVIAESS